MTQERNDVDALREKIEEILDRLREHQKATGGLSLDEYGDLPLDRSDRWMAEDVMSIDDLPDDLADEGRRALMERLPLLPLPLEVSERSAQWAYDMIGDNFSDERLEYRERWDEETYDPMRFLKIWVTRWMARFYLMIWDLAAHSGLTKGVSADEMIRAQYLQWLGYGIFPEDIEWFGRERLKDGHLTDTEIDYLAGVPYGGY